MQVITEDIHEDLKAHFHRELHTESGFGSMMLQSGLAGAGTLYMTPEQAKRLADAIYVNLGLTPP